jgi:molybdopterin-guanine dinucleotide biosynthesis protein A
MGIDKLGVEIDRESLIAQTNRVCRSVFQRVALVMGDGQRYADFQLPEIPDVTLGDGPISGVVAALRHCPDQMCFVTAVVWYGLSDAILADLLLRYAGEAYFGLQENDGMQPLCRIYRKPILPKLERAASSGKFSLRSALRKVHIGSMTACPGSHRININTPCDMAGVQVKDAR